MCGRYTLRLTPSELAEFFDLFRQPEFGPRYNIAPTQQVAVIRQSDGNRELSEMRWGLIPSWAKDEKIGSRMINARSETAAEKPSFRAAFRRRRCLIPADGFFEWQKVEGGKQPYLIGLLNDRPFAFAGLWERWEHPQGDAIESCTILTTTPNELLADIHDRMPVILSDDAYDPWLDPTCDPDALQELLTPYPPDELQMTPVSTVVNNPRNDVPECVEPVADSPEVS